ncbi:hypothetical protein ERJ75_001305900 [Trypanosoma vivax]|nr:hypothetical protein ERJ75_001305900 [Trypanosoma vivax]
MAGHTCAGGGAARLDITHNSGCGTAGPNHQEKSNGTRTQSTNKNMEGMQQALTKLHGIEAAAVLAAEVDTDGVKEGGEGMTLLWGDEAAQHELSSKAQCAGDEHVETQRCAKEKKCARRNSARRTSKGMTGKKAARRPEGAGRRTRVRS